MSALTLAPAGLKTGARRPPVVVTAGAVLVLVVVAAVLAPLLAPYAPDAIDLSASLVARAANTSSAPTPPGRTCSRGCCTERAPA